MSIQLTKRGAGEYSYIGTAATYTIWSEKSAYGDLQWYMKVEYADGSFDRDYRQADYLKTMRWIIEGIEEDTSLWA